MQAYSTFLKLGYLLAISLLSQICLFASRSQAEMVTKETLQHYFGKTPIKLNQLTITQMFGNFTGSYHTNLRPKTFDLVENLAYYVNYGTDNLFQKLLGCQLAVIKPRYKTTVILAIHLYSIVNYPFSDLKEIQAPLKQTKIPQYLCQMEYTTFKQTLEKAIADPQNKCNVDAAQAAAKVKLFTDTYEKVLRPMNRKDCLGPKDLRDEMGFDTVAVACKAKTVFGKLADPENKLTKAVCGQQPTTPAANPITPKTSPSINTASVPATGLPLGTSKEKETAAPIPRASPEATPLPSALTDDTVAKEDKEDTTSTSSTPASSSSTNTSTTETSAGMSKQTKMIAVGTGAAAGVALLLVGAIYMYRARSKPSEKVPPKSMMIRRTLSTPNMASVFSHNTQVPMRVVLPYEPRMDDELRLMEGDEVVVFEEFEDGYGYGENQRNERGIFPLMCIRSTNTRFTTEESLVGGELHQSFVNPNKERYTEYSESII